ncbi:MAG: type II toxin-antitoxin system RelE/ParE family toxin [Coriobacteriia bacterium]|nr:type II toxin-antitoxin system RelE/ParE family toxin [Coriobacteriia bacterium]
MFQIDYCQVDDGHRPAEEFIDGLEPKMRAKVFGRLELLEEYGNRLGMPYSRHLGDGIYELRTVQGSNITRILYFFFVGNRILLTHGFTKKTQKTPKREINRAKLIRAAWRQQHREGERDERF